MAVGKKSFVAYSDWYGTFKAVPDEVAGQLIKYIFSYVNDENPDPHENYVVNALFEQVKATFKWDKQREQRSEAGKKSAEIRATKSNERSTVVNENVRNPTVSVSVSDNVNVIDNNTNVGSKEPIDFSLILKTVNETFGRKYKIINSSVKAKYKARLKDGYSIDDIISAIKNCKVNAYHKENNYQYCTPEFFSRGDKIDMYSQSNRQNDNFDMYNPPSQDNRQEYVEWMEERERRLLKTF